MNENITKIFTILYNTMHIWLPILIIVLSKYIPKFDTIFRSVYVTLDEIDSITDEILEQYDNLPFINNIDDITNEVIKILSRRYKDIDKSKIKNEIENNLIRKEGLTFENGKINYHKKF